MRTPDPALSKPLAGQVALVTGAGRRIGAACAEGLALAGARVAVHAHHAQSAASALCTAIGQQGGQAEPFFADLADPSQVEGLLEQVVGRLGTVQILVNNAAIFQPGALCTTSLAAWNEMLAINLTAPFLLMQAFAKGISPTMSGVIINMIDQRITRPRPGHLAYTVAKSALWTMTQMAALELAPAVRVNAIAPGPILPAAGDGEERFQQIAEATPLGRAGSPQDVVDLLLFLVQSPFITGEMVCVDGGEHL
ncbi:MAG: SDR family oxidoreductase [Magnetococcales bacterium]|nr:SDR family oxidoreductase [Magnetococcales bacterium]